jgi:hypothetical protein
LPFASLLAGVYIAAELARRTVSDYAAAQPNFAGFDFYPAGFSLETQQRTPLSSCDCPSQLALSRLVNAAQPPPSSVTPVLA